MERQRLRFDCKEDSVCAPGVSPEPAALPAWGKENYRGLKVIEPMMAVRFLGVLSSQWWRNASGFKRYANE